MVLSEKSGDFCPWDYHRHENDGREVSFPLCHGCPMMEKIVLFSNDTIDVFCEKEGDQSE